jgi:periplasmic divalent cation tolerance protein
MQPSIFLLTCANEKEANKIKKALHKKKLSSCIKATDVNSSFLWKGKMDKADEILLIIDSYEELFDKAEAEIRKIHSYDTFVLLSLPISKMSKGVREWMGKETK